VGNHQRNKALKADSTTMRRTMRLRTSAWRPKLRLKRRYKPNAINAATITVLSQVVTRA